MRVRVAGVIAILVLVSGCVRLSQPAPEIRAYRLDYAPPAVAGNALPVTVRVLPFNVAAIYDREPMAYRDDAYTTGVDFYNRWSTNPGHMVADLLARDFASSGLYGAVQQAPSLLPSDYLLNGEIEEIEERARGASCDAHLRLRILLVRTRGTGDPVMLRSAYAADEPCVCADSLALAGAMSRSLERVSTQLQQEVYAAIANDKR